ncbi:hypothetical protein [Micromonospora sp. NPDC047187]|uniref:effector-associated constant component EACC1 n=1 Tax=Micromonospora sp. NPDC047187 TaxID=3155262 RepID=UPI0033E8A5D5
MDDNNRLELKVSDQSQLLSLHRTLSLVPAARVERVPGVPAAGELGTVDFLVAVGGSGALIAVVKMLPDFLQARRSDLSVEIVKKGQTVRVTATNIDDIMPVLTAMIDE